MLNRSIAFDDRFTKLTPVHQWLFMRLIPFQDDYGRMTGNITELRYQTIPSENITDEEMCKLLNDIAETKLISWIPGVVIQFWGIDKNNKFNHRKANSLFPDIRQLTGKGQESLRLKGVGDINIININNLSNKELKEDFYRTSEINKNSAGVHIKNILKKWWQK